jgi:protocatechuate 3,4-dioxygenase beta subunit
MAIYSIRYLGRREILVMSAVLAGSGTVFSPKPAAAEVALQRTPDQILGPFYPLSGAAQTSDLTKVSGRSGRAEGQGLNVMGRVLNLAGEPVRNAKIEVWQANTYGRYTHPSDPNPAPLTRTLRAPPSPPRTPKAGIGSRIILRAPLSRAGRLLR